MTRGLERDRITGAAEPEYKSKRGYTVHAAKAMAGHPIWDMTSMTPEKVQEIPGPLTKEQLEVKIQQANTVIQTYKSQLDGYESDDVARREKATRESAWRTTLKLIETEEALQSVTQQETGRPLPSWIRDIAGGLDGREGFRALKEAVVGMQRELEELRTQAANAPAAPAPAPAAPAAAAPEDAAMPTPEEAYIEAAGAIEQRDQMMASFVKMREELEVEREKRQAASNVLRNLEEKLASGGIQENVKDMSERIRAASNRADEEGRRADEEKGKRKELEREVKALRRSLEKEEAEHNNTKQLATIRERKIEALEDEAEKAERRLDSAGLGQAAATMREDLNAVNDKIKEMKDTIRRLEGESRTSRARSRYSRRRGRSGSGSMSSSRSSSMQGITGRKRERGVPMLGVTDKRDRW